MNRGKDRIRSFAASLAALGLGLVVCLVYTMTSAGDFVTPDPTAVKADAQSASAMLGPDDGFDCHKLTHVALKGGQAGNVGTTYWFTGTVSPPATTAPIDYKWEAVGQVLDSHLQRPTLTDTKDYTWAFAGTYTVTLTATNRCGLEAGEATATHRVVIGVSPPPCQAVMGLTITGPASGIPNTAYGFAAEASPLTAERPITYSWQTSDNPAQTHTVQEVRDEASFSWATPGDKQITVEAVNRCGHPVSQTHSILIEPDQPPMDYYYLPLVSKGYLTDPFEPNDEYTQAYGPLKLAKTYYAYIPDANDRDDYYFLEINLANMVSVHAELTVPNTLDLDLYVYDKDLRPVASSNTSGRGIDEQASFTPEQTGKYYVRVYPFAGHSRTDAYALKVWLSRATEASTSFAEHSSNAH